MSKKPENFFSYKEVALAAPGTIVKAVAEQLPKENPTDEISTAVEEPKKEDEQHKKDVEEVKETPEVDTVIEPETVDNTDPGVESVESSEISKVEIETEPIAEVADEDDDKTPNEEGSQSQSQSESQSQSPGMETETERERAKEAASKKLSAAAPPFSPSNIPVFGSVLKDHGGILPPPVNIPTMVTVTPVRRNPHQSATARVPYGPRLAGGYNRSVNRAQRNKPPAFELVVDGAHLIPPTVMNPHAAEFVPGQPWVPNGYPVAPNGYLVTSGGYPISPNGYAVNGFPSQNGYPVSPVDSVESPVSSVDSPSVVTTQEVCVTVETPTEHVGENKEEVLENVEKIGEEIQSVTVVVEETQSVMEEKAAEIVDAQSPEIVDEKPIKNGEVETIEVTS